ncbi:MAG: hypothetical protein GY719_07515 [bacterium]|nr:hypothetical protein [bacterium]
MTRGRLVFICLSLTTVLLVASATMLAANNRQHDDGADSLYKYISVFTDVFNLVNKAYVDELDPEALMAGAFEGAADALDPFSLYVPAEQAEKYQATLEVGRQRSGILVLKERGVAYAVAVEEGSPAALAGIETGHILSILQGKRTRQMPLYEIQSILAGSLGTEIEVERIEPRGQKEMIKFELAEYEPPAVELRVERGVGVLRLPAFHAQIAASVEASLRTLGTSDEALADLTETDKLVVDLRGVAGGDPQAAYRIAAFFAAGELGALKAREETLETFDGGDSPLWQGKVAVLVNRGTQGAAEVLAAVLKQSTGASLVGEPSFGHSGRQRLIELSNGGRLQVTDAFYTGPDREPITDGLEPDLGVRPNLDDTEDTAPDADEVLERGLKLLFGEEEVEEKAAA